jgi:hypothetical protein
MNNWLKKSGFTQRPQLTCTRLLARDTRFMYNPNARAPFMTLANGAK